MEPSEEGKFRHADPPLVQEIRYESRSADVLDHASASEVVASRHPLIARDWLHALMVSDIDGAAVSTTTTRDDDVEILPAASVA